MLSIGQPVVKMNYKAGNVFILFEPNFVT